MQDLAALDALEAQHLATKQVQTATPLGQVHPRPFQPHNSGPAAWQRAAVTLPSAPSAWPQSSWAPPQDAFCGAPPAATRYSRPVAPTGQGYGGHRPVQQAWPRSEPPQPPWHPPARSTVPPAQWHPPAVGNRPGGQVQNARAAQRAQGDTRPGPIILPFYGNNLF